MKWERGAHEASEVKYDRKWQLLYSHGVEVVGGGAVTWSRIWAQSNIKAAEAIRRTSPLLHGERTKIRHGGVRGEGKEQADGRGRTMTVDESSRISATYLMCNTPVLFRQGYNSHKRTHRMSHTGMPWLHTTLMKTASNLISHLSELVRNWIESRTRLWVTAVTMFVT